MDDARYFYKCKIKWSKCGQLASAKKVKCGSTLLLVIAASLAKQMVSPAMQRRLFIHVIISSAQALLEDYVQVKLAVNGIGSSINTNRGWKS